MAKKKHKKKGAKPGPKGKGYEREIANILTPWVGFELIRTPMSGAWAGSKGDIVPKNREQYFPLTIECKKTEGWNWHQIFKGEGELHIGWIPQVIREATDDAGIRGVNYSLPVTIFSQNYKPNYVCLPWMFHTSGHFYCFEHGENRDEFFICLLERFLQEYSYEKVLQMVKTVKKVDI